MKQEEEHKYGKSPLFGSWRNFYLVVIGWLILLILLFYAFTIYFR